MEIGYKKGTDFFGVDLGIPSRQDTTSTVSGRLYIILFSKRRSVTLYVSESGPAINEMKRSAPPFLIDMAKISNSFFLHIFIQQYTLLHVGI